MLQEFGEGKVSRMSNVNAFWTAPAPSITSARRLLRRRGRLYVIYEPPSAARLASMWRDARRGGG